MKQTHEEKDKGTYKNKEKNRETQAKRKAQRLPGLVEVTEVTYV